MRSRLCLERLEDRSVPANLSWDPLGASTDWSAAANWHNNDTGMAAIAPPSASDTVKIGDRSNNSVTLAANTTVKSLTMTAGYNGTLNLNAFVLRIDAGAGNGALPSGELKGGTIINFMAPGKLEIYRGSVRGCSN
jgi:hypothetical protein